MQTKMIDTPNGVVAVTHCDTPILCDGQTAFGFAVNAGSQMIFINKDAIMEDFSTY